MSANDEADVGVIRAPSLPMAQMWAELLGGQGITCRIVRLDVGGSVYAPAIEDFEVRVLAIDVQRALELLPPQPRATPEERADVDDDPPGAADVTDDEGLPVADAPDAPDAPVDRGRRWAIVFGLVAIGVFVLFIAARFFAPRGFL
jgi:hypothetical protein